jgi:hypothetical protein
MDIYDKLLPWEDGMDMRTCQVTVWMVTVSAGSQSKPVRKGNSVYSYVFFRYKRLLGFRELKIIVQEKSTKYLRYLF